MLLNTFIAIALIFLALLAWILVQHAARLFATRHPEFGPAKEEGGGCSLLCLCRDTNKCPKQKLLKAFKSQNQNSASIEKD